MSSTVKMININSPTGPNMFAIIPFGRANDWNFKHELFCVHYRQLFGSLRALATGLTVPSMKLKQLFMAAPLALRASAYV